MPHTFSQIQFIKRELMVAMESIDKLLQENQFNLQVHTKPCDSPTASAL